MNPSTPAKTGEAEVRSTPMKSPLNRVLPALDEMLSDTSYGSLDLPPLPPTKQNLTPMKSQRGLEHRRSVSTPMDFGLANSLRVISLTTTPIPDLSPERSVSDILLHEQEIETPHSSNRASKSIATGGSPNRSVSSPLLYKSSHNALEDSPSRRATKRRNVQPEGPKQGSREELSDLRRAEALLDSEINRCESQVNLLTQAAKYLQAEKMMTSVEKWREVGQQAAEQLLERAKEKVENMGGYDKYREQRESRRLYLEEEEPKEEPESQEITGEMDMRALFEELGMDYRLFY